VANTLITPTIVARESLIALENNMVMGNLVHRDFSKEFSRVGATVLARKPSTFTATAVASTSTVAVQNLTESSVAVVLDNLLDVSVELTSYELSLDIVDFQEEVAQPMMRAIAQKVDTLLTALYVNIAGHTDVSSTPAVTDIAELGAQLNLQKAPLDQRRAILCPVTHARYVGLDSFLHAEKRGGEKIAIKEAEIGRVLGMDFYIDQNIVYYDSGIADTAGAMTGAATAGQSTITIDALTASEVIAAGDVMKVVGSDKGYLITTGGTVSAGGTAASLVISPALDRATLDNAVVTFQSDGDQNLAFHKNCFALVSAPLEPPLGGAKAAVASYNGLSCRVVYDYNITNKKNQLSIDFLCGVKTLDKDLAARLIDSQ